METKITTSNVTRAAIRTLAAAAMLAAFAAAPHALQARQPAGPDAQALAARSLPKYFDQLDLSDEQKAQTFKVLDRFNPLIEGQAEMAKAVAQSRDLISMVAAVRTLKALKANRTNALLKILNDDQRDKLKELKEADAPPKP